MKILKIEFTNINSLRGSHTIDFSKEPFISSSLFAITGPTGSGKSTILDVISLAIYGKIPRIPGSRPISKTDIEKFGTILTRNQKEAIARVTYECKYGIFSSQWNISTNRNDNLRDNDMEIFDHQKQELITDKKSEVPDKNEELIGLNYDQFIKAVLLAQGEFAQFLKVSKKERGALLEKITGTGIYRLIGQKVYEKNSALNKDIEVQQIEIQSIKKQLLDDETLDLKKAELKNKTEVRDKIQKEIDRLNDVLKLKQDIRVKSNEKEEYQASIKTAFDDLKKFKEAHGSPLEQHEKVEDFSEELRNWNLLNKEINNFNSTIIEIKDSIKKSKDEADELISEVKTLTRKPTSPTNFASNLSDFRDQILKLQNRVQEIRNEYKLEKTKLKAELQALGININEAEPELTHNEIQQNLSVTKGQIEKWQSTFTINKVHEIQNLKDTLETELKLTRDAAREYASIEKAQTEYDRNSSELQKLQPYLDSLPGKIEKQELLVDKIKTELKNLNLEQKNQLLQARLEDLRNELANNEPCPLCGSLHHPYAEHLPEKDDFLKQKISDVEDLLKEQTSILNTLTANLTSYKEQASKLKEQVHRQDNNLQNLKKEFHKKFSLIEDTQNLDELNDRCDILDTKIKDLSQYDKELQKLEHLKNALPIAEKLQSILKDGKDLREELNTLYTGSDIQQEVENYQNRWTGLQSDLRNRQRELEKLTKQQAEKEKRLLSLENDLNPKLVLRGFEGITVGFAALMREADVRSLRSQREEIQKKIDSANTRLEVLTKQIEKFQNRDIQEKEEKVKEELQEKRQLIQTIEDERIQIKRILDNQEDNLDSIKKLQDQIADTEKQTRRWRMLNELIGDRTGNKFNDFAQDLTLSRLIKLANNRLKDLSDRYLIDKPTDEEDDGLVAIDEHMGGQRRSVKTLSGGETFILSLSMALALSDLASKNVEINSLFIDEGFGTLDPETLDQTLDTLERLQTESSKTIGVISHVDSLKERISTQIRLNRNGQGYSSLSIG